MATVGQKKANKSKTGTYTSSSGRVYTSSKAKSNSGNSGSSGGSSSSSGFPMASAAVRASALAEANAVERRMGSRLTTAAEAESRRVAAGKEIQRQRAIDPTYGQGNITINSDNLGTKPYTIPDQPTIPDYSPIVSNAFGTVPTVSEVPTEQSVIESQKQNFQSMLDELQKPVDTASIYNKLERQNQIRQKEQAVSNYQSQLNNIVATRDAQVLGLEGQGRGQTSGFIGGEQARINREAAIQALPIQAQLSAAQGDLELAKSHVDKMFQIYATDAENKVNFYNNLVKMTYEFQDKQDQRKLDAISKQKEFEQKILMSNMDAQQKYMNTALENGQIGAFNALSSIQPPTDINSPTFKQDMARYNEKVNAAVAKYAVGASPSGGRALSSLPVSIQGKVISAAEKFGTSDIVKKFNATVDSINVVNGISSNSQNPADHQAIVYSFAKALDPDSAVKEGEYETIKKYAQSAISRYGKEISNALNGTGFLSEKAIDDIKTTMNNLYVSRKPQYDNAYSERARIINNIAGQEVAGELLTDYSSGANLPNEIDIQDSKTFDDVVSKPDGYWSKLWSAIIGK